MSYGFEDNLKKNYLFVMYMKRPSILGMTKSTYISSEMKSMYRV